MTAPAQPAAEIVGERHWARKGNAVSLALYRKRSAELRRGATPLVLVHGSSLAALPTYDLHVPGKSDYSMMEWFAARGYDVWTLDHEGYGDSTIGEGNADVATGAADLAAAIPSIERETGAERVLLYGMSSGALRAGMFAAAAPERVRRLVLDAFVWTGEGSETLRARREGLATFRARNRRPIDAAFIASIFTRDRPGTTEPEVIEACAAAQLAYGETVPTGTYLDMTQNLPLVAPERLSMPTMVVRGEHDKLAAEADLLAFVGRLAAREKAYAVLPDLAHCTPLGADRHRMWRAVEAFFARDAA